MSNQSQHQIEFITDCNANTISASKKLYQWEIEVTRAKVRRGYILRESVCLVVIIAGIFAAVAVTGFILGYIETNGIDGVLK